MSKLSLVAAMFFCFPLLLARPVPVNANIDPEVRQGIVLLKSVKGIRVVRRLAGIATGYYSPQKGQKKYACGSYVKEVQLNGKGGETATGGKPRIGTISANLKLFPPKTLLRITDTKSGRQVYGVVEDTGSAMIRNQRHVDIWMGEGQMGLNESVEWGKRAVVIEVIKLIKA